MNQKIWNYDENSQHLNNILSLHLKCSHPEQRKKVALLVFPLDLILQISRKIGVKFLVGVKSIGATRFQVDDFIA